MIQPAAPPDPVAALTTPNRALEKGIAMDLHPLHAFYLRRSDGEVGTFPRRARLAPARSTAPVASASTLGLGLVAAVLVVARLTGARPAGR